MIYDFAKRLGALVVLGILVLVLLIVFVVARYDITSSSKRDLLIPAVSTTPVQVSYTAPLPRLTKPTLTTETRCRDYGNGCRAYALSLINQARVAVGAAPLTLDWSLSKGYGCVGPVGHARAMYLDNNSQQPIWHISPDAAYDYASFNQDMAPCVGFVPQGQNIGLTYNEAIQPSILTIHQEMMAEPHDPAYCASFIDHACNLLSRSYTRVGIGFYQASGRVYLVWDFAG